jgi:hypothetical protein
VYVDGMPADAIPDAALIAGLAVNADPFSAEYGGVDEQRIDLTLMTPDRRWRFNASPPTFDRDARNPLTSRPSPAPSYRSAGLSGPIPRLPVTFFAQGHSYLDRGQPAFLSAGDAGLVLDTADGSATTSSGASAGAVLVAGRATIRTTYSRSTMHADGAGTGGFTGPSAASAMLSRSQQLQTTWRVATPVEQRGGVVVRRHTLDASAVSDSRGLIVTGQLVSGGNTIRQDGERLREWTAKHVLQSRSLTHPWTAGVEAARTSVDATRLFNPAGVLQVDRLDASHGSWTVRRQAADVAVDVATAAAFLDYFLVQRPAFSTRVGARGDWQQGDGLLVSPRITSRAAIGPFEISAGAGLFVDSWPAALLSELAARDGSHGDTFVTADAPIDLVEPPEGGERLRLERTAAFTRRRDLVARASLQRRFGHAVIGVEHTATAGFDLAGLTRVRGTGTLTDRLDSDRRLRRHQTHLRTDVEVAGLSVTSHYEFVESRDDTDGPLSLPALQHDVAGEWAPSSAIARHNLSIVAAFGLPGGVRVSATASAASGLPYSVLTGRDEEGLSTFTDRGGRRRNGSLLPGTRRVHVYASRRIVLPGARGLAFDAGVRAENLLGHTDILEVGRVAGTPWFGRAVAAGGGRSLGAWIRLSR